LSFFSYFFAKNCLEKSFFPFKLQFIDTTIVFFVKYLPLVDLMSSRFI
jgi:hypothetical protein